MTVQTRPLEIPANDLDYSDQTDQTDNSENSTNRRIRVQNASAGYGMMPHVIKRLALKEIKCEAYRVFDFIWSKTVSRHKFDDSIPMSQFLNALPCSRRTINSSCNWLRDNGWITVDKISDRKPKRYGIPEKILRSAGCIDDVEDEENSPTANIALGPTANIAPFIRNDLRHKKTSLSSYTPNSISVGDPKPILKINDDDVSYITDKKIEEWVEKYGSRNPRQLRGLLDLYVKWGMHKRGAEYLLKIGFVEDLADIALKIKHKLDSGAISKREDPAAYLVQCVKNELLDNTLNDESQAGGE